jgi:Na+-transporting NADH:ubiquinone oxidoreductase subunit B
MIHGALYYLPVLVTTMAAGGLVEAISAIIRRHEINEGFLVSGMLFPLVLPPTIPLWMVFLGISFGIIFGKEVFGGTGMNFLNPALVGRAFLFFAYPAFMSGDAPWIAADFSGVDSFTGATWLAQAAVTHGVLEGASWWEAFVGRIPGSMGETSTLCCLLGAGVLILTRIGSWRTMTGVTVGTVGMALILNGAGSESNPLFAVPFYWHFVLGGWAFGMVFMATDPVSSAFTNRGKWAYGIGIGVLCVLIRVVNPAYPEGMMLSILFMNMFAPLIDHFVVQANIRRREAGYAT